VSSANDNEVGIENENEQVCREQLADPADIDQAAVGTDHIKLEQLPRSSDAIDNQSDAGENGPGSQSTPPHVLHGEHDAADAKEEEPAPAADDVIATHSTGSDAGADAVTAAPQPQEPALATPGPAAEHVTAVGAEGAGVDQMTNHHRHKRRRRDEPSPANTDAPAAPAQSIFSIAALMANDASPGTSTGAAQPSTSNQSGDATSPTNTNQSAQSSQKRAIDLSADEDRVTIVGEVLGARPSLPGASSQSGRQGQPSPARSPGRGVRSSARVRARVGANPTPNPNGNGNGNGNPRHAQASPRATPPAPASQGDVHVLDSDDDDVIITGERRPGVHLVLHALPCALLCGLLG
jgi:hypothetical protein